MTKITAKAQKAIDEYVHKYPDHWTGGVCAFAMIDRTSGDELTGRTTTAACHAAISYIWNGAQDRKLKSVVVNAHKFAWHQKSPEFMRWLAHEAPFSHGVLNADNEKEFFEHAGVLDMEIIGQGGVLWQCKAMRHFTEDTHVPGLWTQLREHGLDGLQAFIGADIMDANGNAKSSSHVCLYGYAEPAKLRKIYDNIRNKKKWDGGEVSQRGMYNGKFWGGMKTRAEKKPDGWGGFIEVQKPADVKDYVAQLREIFEGDPKNVG